MPIHLRRLGLDDAPAFRPLRLRALREHPQAFGAHPDEEVARDIGEWARRLEPGDGAFVIGAFDEATPVGMVGFRREAGLKNRHKGNIWGMYVRRESSGQGIGRLLVTHLIEEAREMAGLEQILLGVVRGNEGAEALYRSLGFETFGLEPRAIRVGEDYLDEAHMILRLS